MLLACAQNTTCIYIHQQCLHGGLSPPTLCPMPSFHLFLLPDLPSPHPSWSDHYTASKVTRQRSDLQRGKNKHWDKKLLRIIIAWQCSSCGCARKSFLKGTNSGRDWDLKPTFPNGQPPGNWNGVKTWEWICQEFSSNISPSSNKKHEYRDRHGLP